VAYCAQNLNTCRRRAAALQVYRIMLQYTTGVQPISCDEAFLDVTGASLHHDGSPRKDGGIFPLERNLPCLSCYQTLL
jgi:hypothetical protein